MILILLSIFSLALLNSSGMRPPAEFREHTIANGLRGGYQVVATDLNHDGRIDLIALASGMKDLLWFENPGWEQHVLASGLSRMINAAAADTDGDGIPEVVVAREFSNDPANSAGIVSLLTHGADVRAPWSVTEIDRLPTSHRLRWADFEHTGRKVLVNAPLAGALSKAPDYRDKVPLVFYRPGRSWKRELISDRIEGVLHGIFVTDWDRDGRDDLLAASFLGIDLFRLNKQGAWTGTTLAAGNPEPWPKSGSSEVAVGELGKEKFLCTIEPWHGNQVVVYKAAGDSRASRHSNDARAWKRSVIDNSLSDGHTLLTADFNRDGRDEIIAGFRGKGQSVYLYWADQNSAWTRRTLDDGGIAAAGCAVADLNGDGFPDVACIGSATANLKWYENVGK
jgi:hypothetical protein